MRLGYWAVTIYMSCVMSLFLPPIYAQEGRSDQKTSQEKESSQLVGAWEIYQTKEPGKPYLQAYKGRPFVSKGPNAFTLFLEYKSDGKFRRISRIGDAQTVEEGSWRLNGHELRHKRNGSYVEEIMYLRFDNKDQYTSTEVFEETGDPGLFAKFRRSQIQ